WPSKPSATTTERAWRSRRRSRPRPRPSGRPIASTWRHSRSTPRRPGWRAPRVTTRATGSPQSDRPLYGASAGWPRWPPTRGSPARARPLTTRSGKRTSSPRRPSCNDRTSAAPGSFSAKRSTTPRCRPSAPRDSAGSSRAPSLPGAGELTARAMLGRRGGPEVEARESLKKAEVGRAAFPGAARPPPRRAEVDQRLWWGYAELGSRRLEAGEYEEALDPLIHALRF